MTTPVTAVEYPGDGTTTDFNFPFDYLDETHVTVYLDGVETAAWSLLTESTVRMTVAPSSGVTVRIERVTPTTAIVTWSDGAIILGRDLNKAREQPQYIAEEARFIAEEALDTAQTSLADAQEARDEAVAAAAAASDDADAAAASALSASGSATTATTQAGIATTKAGEADTSADAAASSALSASTSANTASTKADEASASATAALGHANSASSSASTATTKANEASASAAAAEGFADAAEASAAGAAASAVNAVTQYDSFDDRYLGSKASDPSVDNDGNALLVGALYFNSTISKMKLWTGSEWALAYNDSAAASAITNDSGVSGATVAAALNTLNSGKAATSHSHAISDTTGLQAALDGKQASLGYTPVNKAGDTMTGALRIDQAYALSTEDLNDVVKCGWYRLASGHANLPAGTDYGLMEVCRGMDTIFQRVTAYDSAKTYTRAGSPTSVGGIGGWSAWVETQKAITVSTSDPSGGSDGDIWFKREA